MDIVSNLIAGVVVSGERQARNKFTSHLRKQEYSEDIDETENEFIRTLKKH